MISGYRRLVLTERGIESMGAGSWVDIHVAIVVNLESDHAGKDTISI